MPRDRSLLVAACCLLAIAVVAPAAALPADRAPDAATGPNRTVTGHLEAPPTCWGCSLDPYVGADLTLNGTRSAAPDGDSLRYRWRVVETPAGGNVHLVTPRNATTRAVVDSAGRYVFSLTVTDGSGAADTARVAIRVTRPDGGDRGILPPIDPPIPVPVVPPGNCTVTIPEDPDCDGDWETPPQDPGVGLPGNDTDRPDDPDPPDNDTDRPGIDLPDNDTDLPGNGTGAPPECEVSIPEDPDCDGDWEAPPQDPGGNDTGLLPDPGENRTDVPGDDPEDGDSLPEVPEDGEDDDSLPEVPEDDDSLPDVPEDGDRSDRGSSDGECRGSTLEEECDDGW